MPDRAEKTLVISDGSLPALVAAAIVSEQSAAGTTAPPSDLPGIVWAVPSDPRTAAERWPACDAAAARQADLYGLGYLPQTPAFGATIESFASMPAGQAETITLVHAAYLAAQHACGRILWPVQHPFGAGEDPDLDAIGRSVDRAVLVGRAVSMDLARPEWAAVPLPGVSIETPFVDFTDEQIADLSRDLEVPVESCWWWGTGAGNIPGAADEFARWSRLVRPSVIAEPKPAPAHHPARAE